MSVAPTAVLATPSVFASVMSGVPGCTKYFVDPCMASKMYWLLLVMQIVARHQPTSAAPTAKLSPTRVGGGPGGAGGVAVFQRPFSDTVPFWMGANGDVAGGV